MTRRQRRRRGWWLAVLAVGLSASAVALAPVGSRAIAQETEPTTTTEPPPEPTTTTEAPPPEPTTTTEAPPPEPTTSLPPSETTEPPRDTTSTSAPPSASAPQDVAKLAGTLDPSEALVPRPEFGSLTNRQRALVQQLQTATDAYTLRRFALVDLGLQVAAADAAFRAAAAVEREAVERELFGLADAANFRRDVAAPTVSVLAVVAPHDSRRARRETSGEQLTAFRAVSRRLRDESRNARLTRERAQSVLDDVTARVVAQHQAIADALDERVAAESAIQRELGPGAVGARPDGITATLAAAQAGQPDPFVIGGIGDPLPGSSLSSPFGLRNDPIAGGAGFHPGVDLTAGPSPLIHAAAAGVVVTAGDCGGYGYCVVIDHGTSLATLYGHQSQVMVHVGEHVDAGAVIGRVGSTGMSTGPHLHFEVRLHGLPIDPVLALFPV